MGFFDRNREQLVNKGIDSNRLPSGKYLTERFPVLHVGDVPTYKPGEWDLTISGLVHQPFTINFEELCAMPSVTLTTDIHCVTKWSKFDTVWKGVKVRDLFERAGVQPTLVTSWGMPSMDTRQTFLSPTCCVMSRWLSINMTDLISNPYMVGQCVC